MPSPLPVRERATGPRRRRLLGWMPAAALGGVGLGATPFEPAQAAAADGAGAAALPPELSRSMPEARLQGGADFRYLGLRIYRVRLWTPRPLKPDEGWEHPLGLELIYARKLVGRLIAERSIEEMRRVGPFTAAEGERWLAAMSAIFPDVQAGERLTGVQQPGRGARFYHQGLARGSVDDARFAQLFFGIWLSPRTSDPTLRERLLGVRS